MSGLRGICLAVLAFWSSGSGYAHHSPGAVVELLTERIVREGARPELLVRRADELRTMGDLDRAIEDYRAALNAASEYATALSGLIRAELAAERPDAALRLAEKSIAGAGMPSHEVAQLHALAASAAAALGAESKALTHWQAAINSDFAEIDWFLQHAATLQRLGRLGDASAALKNACEQNPSHALRRAWIESLIDIGDYGTAEPLIEAGLARSRRKATWLLMRARLRLAEGDRRGCRHDAETAIAEWSDALVPGVENPIFLSRVAAAERLLEELAGSGPSRSAEVKP